MAKGRDEPGTPLAKVTMFAGLSPESLAIIASIASEVHCAADTVLFRTGDLGDRMYVVSKGKVRISRTVPGMGEEALAMMGPGDHFGELALIDSSPRSADAIIHEDCTLLEIRKDALEHMLFIDRDLAYEVLWNMVRTLTTRLRETTDKITFLSVTGRFS